MLRLQQAQISLHFMGGRGGEDSKYTKAFSLLSLQHLLLAPLAPFDRQKPQFKYAAPMRELGYHIRWGHGGVLVSGSQPLTLGVPLNCHQVLSQTTSYEKQINSHAVAEQRVPVPPLYTIITARRPWPVGNSGKEKSATLLMLPVCLFSKHKLTHISMEKMTMENI